MRYMLTGLGAYITMSVGFVLQNTIKIGSIAGVVLWISTTIAGFSLCMILGEWAMMKERYGKIEKVIGLKLNLNKHLDNLFEGKKTKKWPFSITRQR
jgi:hypothetical protein